MTNKEETPQKAAFTVGEFCARNRISRGSLYNYLARGIGPRCMKVGARRLITAEAEADWHRDREAAAAAAVKPRLGQFDKVRVVASTRR